VLNKVKKLATTLKKPSFENRKNKQSMLDENFIYKSATLDEFHPYIE
jgi:hypothetical protein